MTRGAERTKNIQSKRFAAYNGPRENVVDVLGLRDDALRFASFAQWGAGQLRRPNLRPCPRFVGGIVGMAFDADFLSAPMRLAVCGPLDPRRFAPQSLASVVFW